MVDFARLLLATEVTGAKTYWHMTPPQDSINSTTSVGVGGAGLVPLAYNPVFRGNYMVGNLGMTDVVSQLPLFFGTVPCAKPNDQTIPVPLDAENQTCTTWFGTENVYVHLINFMPVTAITAELFDKGKFEEVWSVWIAFRRLLIHYFRSRLRERRTFSPKQR